MKSFTKTLLASALVAAGMTSVTSAYATPEVSLGGELAVELTDTESSEDLGLDVTTTDFVITVKESFGDVEVEGYQAFEKDEEADDLVRDGAGITVSGNFGSVFIGDDGSGLQVSNVTDVMYNNSDYFTDANDITTNVIDYGLPLGDAFSLNFVVDSSNSSEDDDAVGADTEDFDAFGVYTSYSVSGLTFALGYTDIAEDGAYGPTGDSILNAAISYEGGPISAAIGFEDVDNDITDPDSIITAYLTYTAGAVAVTGYVEDAGDAGDLTSLNVSYSFTDNFYTFLETATGEDDTGEETVDLDNTSIGLVLTF